MQGFVLRDMGSVAFSVLLGERALDRIFLVVPSEPWGSEAIFLATINTISDDGDLVEVSSG